MRKTKAWLCIGGPYDGQRYVSEDEMGFKAIEYNHIKMTWPIKEPIPVSNVKIIYYVADFFRTKDDEVWFWRPHDQSTIETMKMLLTRYEKAANLNWEGNPWGV